MKHAISKVVLALAFCTSAITAQSQGSLPTTFDGMKESQDYRITELDPKLRSQACNKISSVSSDYASSSLSTTYPNGKAYGKLWDSGNGRLIKPNYRDGECVVLLNVSGNYEGSSYNTNFSCKVDKVYKTKAKTVTAGSVNLCQPL